MEHTPSLDVSWQTIGKIFLAGCIFYGLFLVRDLVVWFFFALIISLLLDPGIAFLQRFKIPKIVAVAMVYLSIFGVLGFCIYLLAPAFLTEINQFGKNIPDYFEKINPILKDFGVDMSNNFQDWTAGLVNNLQDSSRSIIRAISVLFNGLTSTILIFVLAFYISLEDKGLERFITLVLPKKYEGSVMTIFERAQYQVAGWFGARILACIFVGLLSLVVFLLFDIKYAFTLAFISGVLTFIPFIGPLVTALATLLFVGASQSWFLAIYMVIALTLIQEIENKIVTPILMKKILDLPPILVLISLLVGGTIFGLLGIMFVVPVFGILYEFFKEFLQKRREELVS